jgi:hypothetical protein
MDNTCHTFVTHTKKITLYSHPKIQQRIATVSPKTVAIFRVKAQLYTTERTASPKRTANLSEIKTDCFICVQNTSPANYTLTF